MSSPAPSFDRMSTDPLDVGVDEGAVAVVIPLKRRHGERQPRKRLTEAERAHRDIDLLIRRIIPAGERPWLAKAACLNIGHADAEIFFPPVGRTAALAKRTCRSCAVRPECLDWAVTHNERHGIWGGMNSGQLSRLRRGREVEEPEP